MSSLLLGSQQHPSLKAELWTATILRAEGGFSLPQVESLLHKGMLKVFPTIGPASRSLGRDHSERTD